VNENSGDDNELFIKIKLGSQNPSAASPKVQALIKTCLALIKNALGSVKHPGYLLLQSLKFEYTTEAN